jgi:tetratricopeptide (TPR) repeat protein
MTDAMFALGTVLYRRNDLERAGEWFGKLLAIDAGHVGAHYQLGKIELQRGRIDEAIAHLALCTRLAPDNKGAHYQLSRAYRLKRDEARAERELAAFRALGSGMPEDTAERDQRIDRIGTRPARAPR